MTTQRPTDEQLSAWLDGELGDDERETVQTWLHEHPEDGARVHLWAADRDALRARFDPVLEEAVPDRLRAAALTGPTHAASSTSPAGASARTAPHWLSWPLARAAVAAGLLTVGGLLGAMLAWQLKPGPDGLQASRHI